MGKRPREEFPAIATLEDGPFSALLGLKVAQAGEGSAIVRMPFSDQILNYGPPDVPIHGGAIASLADFAACVAVWTLPEAQRSATISMTTNYCAPGIQSDLTATATVRSRGRRIATISVAIRDDKDALIADALVTYKIA